MSTAVSGAMAGAVSAQSIAVSVFVRQSTITEGLFVTVVLLHLSSSRAELLLHVKENSSFTFLPAG